MFVHYLPLIASSVLHSLQHHASLRVIQTPNSKLITWNLELQSGHALFSYMRFFNNLFLLPNDIYIFFNKQLNEFPKATLYQVVLINMDLGEPTHTLVPCWMPKPLPPRNQYTGWFAPTISMGTRAQHKQKRSLILAAWNCSQDAIVVTHGDKVP
jgi:hypothetical protein